MERAKHGGRIWIDLELGKGGMVCFTLMVRQKHTYFEYGATYTIGTGSYPQIIHVHEYNAMRLWQTITCTSFMDMNGQQHEVWIPAIKLY